MIFPGSGKKLRIRIRNVVSNTWSIWMQRTVLRYSCVAGARGAPPLSSTRTRPPSAALIIGKWHNCSNQWVIQKKHGLNMESDLQSLFGLHVTCCAQLFLLAETPQHPSLRIWDHIRWRYLSAKIDISLWPPGWDLYYRAKKLVSYGTVFKQKS